MMDDVQLDWTSFFFLFWFFLPALQFFANRFVGPTEEIRRHVASLFRRGKKEHNDWGWQNRGVFCEHAM